VSGVRAVPPCRTSWGWRSHSLRTGGYFSAQVARAAAAAGLTALFTSEPEIRVREVDGCAVLGRFAIRRGNSLDYPAKLVANAPATRYGAWLHGMGRRRSRRCSVPVMPSSPDASRTQADEANQEVSR